MNYVVDRSNNMKEISVSVHLHLPGMGTQITAALPPAYLHGDQYHVLASKTFTAQF